MISQHVFNCGSTPASFAAAKIGADNMTRCSEAAVRNRQEGVVQHHSHRFLRDPCGARNEWLRSLQLAWCGSNFHTRITRSAVPRLQHHDSSEFGFCQRYIRFPSPAPPCTSAPGNDVPPAMFSTGSPWRMLSRNACGQMARTAQVHVKLVAALASPDPL